MKVEGKRSNKKAGEDGRVAGLPKRRETRRRYEEKKIKKSRKC